MPHGIDTAIQWNWNYNTTWDYNNSAAATSVPYYLVPAPTVIEPVDDSPLTWLRGQVGEIQDLARAA